MDTFPLNPDSVVVDSFATASSDPSGDPAVAAAPMKTWEPGCTTPDLCPIGVADPAIA